MMRTTLLVLIALFCGQVRCQQPVKLISLPTLDSTYQWRFLKGAADGYLITTQQPDAAVVGSTMIGTDADGEPQVAYRIPGSITNVILCADGGYLMLGSALIKVDQAFNIQWARKLTAPVPNMFVSGIAEGGGYSYLVYTAPASAIDASLSFYPTYAAVIFKFNGTGDMVGQRILADTVFASSRYNLYQPTP
ncbi:MAG: hypothetical protein WAU70_05445, partial [Flavobacteriales bacterium]